MKATACSSWLDRILWLCLCRRCKIDLSNMSIYDQGCNEEFQNAMKNYFEGNASYDEALDLFYKAVVEKYPELSY